jgi:hypothetical protein
MLLHPGTAWLEALVDQGHNVDVLLSARGRTLRALIFTFVEGLMTLEEVLQYILSVSFGHGDTLVAVACVL